MDIEIKEFYSANDIINYLRLNHEQWQCHSSPDIHGNSWIFRGQENASWDLIPSAHRESKYNQLKNFVYYDSLPMLDKLSDIEVYNIYGASGKQWVIAHPDDVNPDTRDRIQVIQNGAYVLNHLKWELKVVKNFLEQADRLGIATPISDITELEIEDSLSELNRYNYDTGDGITMDVNSDKIIENTKIVIEVFPPPKLKEAFALAQHHGIPTRLLDWSFFPLVALYFAVESVWFNDLIIKESDGSERRIEKWDEKVKEWEKDLTDPGNQVAIWALDSQIDSGLVKAVTPYARNNFLKAQSGLFTYYNNAGSYFMTHSKWPSHYEIIKNSNNNDGFKKLVISKTYIKDILKLLHNERITRAQIMPTLDNIRTSYANFKKLF